MTTYTYPDVQARPRRRRGRRLLVVLIVLLLVLGALLAVADRVGASVAERAIGDQVSQELVAQEIQSTPPEVNVGGFPFLTQVLAGQYESISIQLRDVEGTVEGNGVRLPELNVDARDVTAPLDTLRSGQGDIVASTVNGTATIAYASVVELMDQPGLRLSERDGKLVVTAPVQILGQQFTVNGTAALAVSNGQVQIRFDELTADGLPQVAAAENLINQYAQQISLNLLLPQLPFELDLQDVQARPEGLAVTATAANVALNQA